MKRKTLTLAISVFALLAIISVGFASWVITRPVDEKVATGQIQVDDVTDLNITLSYEWVDDEHGTNVLESAPKIVFGSKGSAENNWLANENSENLVAYLKVNITASKLEALGTKNIVAKFNVIGDLSRYNDLKQKGYIDGNADGSNLATIKSSDFTQSNNVYTVEKIIKIEFKWGQTIFEGNNPIVKWPSWSEENEANATAALKYLYTNLSGISYKVTIGLE